MTANTVSEIVKIKRKIYIELAREVLNNTIEEKIKRIPYKIAQEEDERYRCCVHKERAIIDERIKLALGFDPQLHKEESPTDLLKKRGEEDCCANVVNVIELACDSCPIDKYKVTDSCRNCVAHKCVNVCPVDAIVTIQNKAFIDQKKCIECGRCQEVCPYGAIHENVRPCVRACSVDALSSNSDRKAVIDYDKCVDCGSCIQACPFGAISDSTEIVKVTRSLKEEDENLTALLAPSFVGQFGAKIDPAKIKSALKHIGFSEVREVGMGADWTAAEESSELKEALSEDEFLLSSCCPSFKKLILNEYPDLALNVSSTFSPMVKTAQAVKRDSGNKTVFVGPCIAKKAEACGYKSVDHVLTFEELLCIMVASDMNLANYEKEEVLNDATRHGRQFAYSGGLSQVMQELTDFEIETVKGSGLDQCIELLEQLIDGKQTFDFMEGMACSGGCAGGPAVLNKPQVTKKLVQLFADEAETQKAEYNEFTA